MSAAPKIAFKVELKRKDRESVFHRFSGVYTFAELNTVISHLWGERPKHLCLEYVDDEGDSVRMTSEGEWNECVRIFVTNGAAVLRLTGKRAKDDKSKRRHRDPTAAAEEVAANSDSESEEAKPRSQQPSTKRTPRGEPASAPFSIPTFDAAARLFEHAMSQAQTACGVNAAHVNPVHPETATSTTSGSKSSSSKKREAPTVECDANKAVVDLMSLMYGCDASVELFRGATERFGSVVKRLVNPFMPSEVHLDIDRLKLYRDVVAKGNALIDANNWAEAEELLRTAVVVFRDSVILEYNLACVLSLQERVEEAIELLLAAKSHGYDDVEHLRTDPDLANARKSERWSEVAPVPVVVMPEPVAAPIPVVEEPIVVVPSVFNRAPEPVVPVVVTPVPAAPVQETDPQAMTLMSIFPEMLIEEATLSMKRAKGNLSRAVNARLSGQ